MTCPWTVSATTATLVAGGFGAVAQLHVMDRVTTASNVATAVRPAHG